MARQLDAPAAMTLAEVRELPATVNVPTAARALGVGSSTLYDALSTGKAPVKALKVGGRIRVLTSDLARVLGASTPEGA